MTTTLRPYVILYEILRNDLGALLADGRPESAEFVVISEELRNELNKMCSEREFETHRRAAGRSLPRVQQFRNVFRSPVRQFSRQRSIGTPLIYHDPHGSVSRSRRKPLVTTRLREREPSNRCLRA